MLTGDSITHGAVYTFGWHTLDEFLLRSGVSTAVRERVERARRNTQEAQAKVDAIVTLARRFASQMLAMARQGFGQAGSLKH